MGPQAVQPVTQRRFPPPWSVDVPDMKLGQDCYIVRDANPLAYVYFGMSPAGAQWLT